MSTARQLALQFCTCQNGCPDCRPDLYVGLVECDNCGVWSSPGERRCSRWCRAEVAGLVPMFGSGDCYEILRPGSAEFDRVFGEGGALDVAEVSA